MLGFIKRHAAFLTAALALTLSACNTFTDPQPMPDIYANAETPADKALVTVKAFGAGQDTLEAVCDPEIAEDPAPKEVCIPLIKAEQTLSPAVQALGGIAAEYADVDARIREAGPNAPAEWLALAAQLAAQLSEAYGPIRADVDAFIEKAGALTNG